MYSKKKKIISVNNNATTHVQNNICSELEVTFCSKWKKKVFYLDCFYDRLHFNLQITSGYYGLDLEADQPRMNVEVRVTMTEL